MKTIKISRDKLIEMNSTLKVQEICNKLKISLPTLHKIFKKSGIPMRGMGNRWPRSKYEVI